MTSQLQMLLWGQVQTLKIYQVDGPPACLNFFQCESWVLATGQWWRVLDLEGPGKSRAGPEASAQIRYSHQGPRKRHGSKTSCREVGKYEDKMAVQVQKSAQIKRNTPSSQAVHAELTNFLLILFYICREKFTYKEVWILSQKHSNKYLTVEKFICLRSSMLFSCLLPSFP